MPRCANVLQIVLRFAPPLATRSACRIELRMSRYDGFDGASSIARVTIPSVVLEPSASRRSHSVWAQISPSACTSGRPMILPKSPYVYPPVPAVPSGSPSQAASVDADLAVERLRPDQVVAAGDVVALEYVCHAGVVGHEALADEEVLGVPVAPRLAHRAGLDVAERRVAVGVDDEPVREAVRVLVVDDASLVAAVHLEERVGRERPVEQVHLRPRREAVGRRVEVRVVDVVAVRHPGQSAVDEALRVRAVVGLGDDRVAGLALARRVRRAGSCPRPR